MTDKTMISCIAWIKQGYAREEAITNTELDKQMTAMMDEEELMEEAKKYQEKFDHEDTQSIFFIPQRINRL